MKTKHTLIAVLFASAGTLAFGQTGPAVVVVPGSEDHHEMRRDAERERAEHERAERAEHERAERAEHRRHEEHHEMKEEARELKHDAIKERERLERERREHEAREHTQY